MPRDFRRHRDVMRFRLAGCRAYVMVLDAAQDSSLRQTLPEMHAHCEPADRQNVSSIQRASANHHDIVAIRVGGLRQPVEQGPSIDGHVRHQRSGKHYGTMRLTRTGWTWCQLPQWCRWEDRRLGRRCHAGDEATSVASTVRQKVTLTDIRPLSQWVSS